MNIIEDLTEEEAYLYAILMDDSGIDQCEFSVTEPENSDGCFRCWPFQWAWWRCTDTKQIDRSGRSIGKSMSIEARAYAFPFVHGGDEMVITAPEGVHLDAITGRIEQMLSSNRLSAEIMKKDSRGRFKHRPFEANFANGARIMGRIPQHNGKGVKGCRVSTALTLTKNRGYVKAGDLVIGDELLNDQGKWTKIRKLIYDTNDCYRVEGAGSYPEEVSCDHRFFGASNHGTANTKRNFKYGLGYEDVESLIDNQFYWASPTEFPYVDPIYPEFSNHLSAKHYDVESRDFWWLVGLYIADGYLRNDEDGNPVAINWISHPENKGRKKLIRALEKLDFTYNITERDHSSADKVECYSKFIASWIQEHFGRTAHTKHLPTFMLSLSESFKEAFLDGYLMGDGHYNDKRNRWECSSASKELMMMIQLLAQSIGLKVGASSVQPKVTHVNGTKLKKKPKTSWRLHISLSGHAYEMDGYLVGKVKKVTPIGERPIVNILVEDGKSYLGGTIMNHNIHPIWLELDEAQDYPDQGWTELTETLKAGEPGAVWRAHGVTRGIPDKFQEFTQPNSGWTVHKFCLPGGTMIYTKQGPVPIEDMAIGCEVYCVDERNPNKLKTDFVTDVIDNGVKEIWDVDIHGGYNLQSTGNHPYLVLDRSGTRRTRRELAFEWVEARDLKVGDYVVCLNNLDDPEGRSDLTSGVFYEMLSDGSKTREVPDSIWNTNKEIMKSFLLGYLMGDGYLGVQLNGQDGIGISTSSQVMAKQLRALCHYVGWRTNSIGVTGDLENCPMYRFYVYPDASWYKQVPLAYSKVRDGQMLEGLDSHFVARRVVNSRSTGRFENTYDITVGDSHTYIAEGVVVHNTAVHRPTWTDKERQDKVKDYGSEDNVDFRRNIYGFHGDASNPIFVLSRLMGCVDQQDGEHGAKLSELNENYFVKKIDGEEIPDGGDILDIINLPAMKGTFWIGMDIGWTNDPTEILMFEEVSVGPKSKLVLKLRIQLRRVDAPNQSKLVLYMLSEYNPIRCMLDKTGAGLPLVQFIQALAEEEPSINRALTIIDGFNFSEKILFQIDDSVEVNLYTQDLEKEAGIFRKVLECSTDVLRDLVDAKRIVLPYDKELIREFSGQSYTIDKSTMDMYGRARRFSQGSFHTLDAARMAALGWQQYYFRLEYDKKATKPKTATSVIFL